MSQLKTVTSVPAQPTVRRDAWAELVKAKVESLRFGSVVITVQDSRVVQIDRVEKHRLDSPEN